MHKIVLIYTIYYMQTFQTEKCERVVTVQSFDTGGRCENIPKNVKLISFKDASLLWP